jgi:hypothetical protein
MGAKTGGLLWLIPTTLILAGCSSSTNRRNSGGFQEDEVVIRWLNPTSGLLVACSHDLSNEESYMEPIPAPAGTGVLQVRKFPLSRGEEKLLCLVREVSWEKGNRWEIFTDTYRCDKSGKLQIDLRTEYVADGELAFDTRYQGERCRRSPESNGIVRRIVPFKNSKDAQGMFLEIPPPIRARWSHKEIGDE